MRSWLGLVLFALGCDDGKSDTAQEEEEGFALSEGDWSASPLAAVTDGCSIVEEGGDSFTLNIAMTGDDTFSLTGSELDVSCTLSDQDFTCEEEEDVQDYTAKGADVILTTRFTYAGSFDTETAGSLTYTVDVSCEGTDCSILETDYEVAFPCESAATTTLSFAG